MPIEGFIIKAATPAARSPIDPNQQTFVVMPAPGTHRVSARSSKPSRLGNPALDRHRGTVVEIIDSFTVIVEPRAGALVGERYTCTLMQMRKTYRVLLNCPGRITPVQRASGQIIHYFNPSLGSKEDPNPFLVFTQSKGFDQPFGDMYVRPPFAKEGEEILLIGTCPIAPGSRGTVKAVETPQPIQVSPQERRVKDLGMTMEDFFKQEVSE